MDIETYWERKRRLVPGVQLFSESGARGDGGELVRQWIELIEQDEYLAFDTAQPGVEAVLSRWVSSGCRLRLITLRRREGALNVQLRRLGLANLFDDITVCDPSLGHEGKAAGAVLNVRPSEIPGSAWIGDTEVDARAAAIVGCGSVFLVTCGIRTGDFLRSLNIGRVVPDVPAIRDLM